MIRKKWIKKTDNKDAVTIKGRIVGVDFETEKNRKPTIFGVREYHNNGLEEVTQLKGKDLKKKNIENLLDGRDLMLSYNGSGFDSKIFEEMGINPKHLPKHIDVMYALHRCGIYGGLKKTQKRFGVSRITGYNNNDGLRPVWLYKKAKEGDEYAEAELLLRNEDDTDIKPLFATALALEEMQQYHEIIIKLLENANLRRGDRKILESFLNHLQWGRQLTWKQKKVLESIIRRYSQRIYIRR